MANWIDRLADMGSANGGATTKEGEADPVMQRINEIASGVVRTVWDFSQQQGEAVFCLFDFDEGKIGALVQTPSYGLQDVTILHTLEGGYYFDPNPERLEKLGEYFKHDFEHMCKIFELNKKMKPRKIWAMKDITNPERNMRLVIDYTFRENKLLDFENSMGEWQDILNATGWWNFQV